MTLTYEDLHKLFCPADSWYESRLRAITDDQKKEWMKSFMEYCKCVRRQANKEIKEYAMKIEAEIRDQRLMDQRRKR